jgi:hypothetical protein
MSHVMGNLMNRLGALLCLCVVQMWLGINFRAVKSSGMKKAGEDCSSPAFPETFSVFFLLMLGISDSARLPVRITLCRIEEGWKVQG